MSAIFRINQNSVTGTWGFARQDLDLFSSAGSVTLEAQGPATTYSWELISYPEGSAAVVADPTVAVASIDLDVTGGYLIRLTTDAALPTKDISVLYLGVPLAYSGFCIPAFNETFFDNSAGDGTRGYERKLTAYLKWLDTTLGSVGAGIPAYKASCRAAALSWDAVLPFDGAFSIDTYTAAAFGSINTYSIDGVTDFQDSDKILFLQASAPGDGLSGIWEILSVGSPTTPFVLRRAAGCQAPSDIAWGDVVYVVDGGAYGGMFWWMYAYTVTVLEDLVWRPANTMRITGTDKTSLIQTPHIGTANVVDPVTAYLHITGSGNTVAANSAGVWIHGQDNTVATGCAWMTILGPTHVVGASCAASVVDGASNILGASTVYAQIHGVSNTVGANTNHATVFGSTNTVAATAQYAFVQGSTNTVGENFNNVFGLGNTVTGLNSDHNTVIGIGNSSTGEGAACNLIYGSSHSLSGGGINYNTITGSAHTIGSATQYNLITGQGHTLAPSGGGCNHNAISGFEHQVASAAQYNIIGGFRNTVGGNANKNIIGGGLNTVPASTIYSLILGTGITGPAPVQYTAVVGQTNAVAGMYGLVIGTGITVASTTGNFNTILGETHTISAATTRTLITGTANNVAALGYGTVLGINNSTITTSNFTHVRGSGNRLHQSDFCELAGDRNVVTNSSLGVVAQGRLTRSRGRTFMQIMSGGHPVTNEASIPWADAWQYAGAGQNLDMIPHNGYTTAGSTWTRLAVNGAGGTRYLNLMTACVYCLETLIVATDTTGVYVKAWKVTLTTRAAGLVGSPVYTVLSSTTGADEAAWDVRFSIAGDALSLEVLGSASEHVAWQCYTYGPELRAPGVSGQPT